MASSDFQPSPSSQGCTFLRALSQFERHPKLRNPDYLAGKFLSPTHHRLLKVARPWWAHPILKRVSPGAYFYQISRIRFGDEALLKALEEGIRQVVIMGAGNDTRAFRFQDALLRHKARVIELDIPSSQAWKTQKVIEYWGELPGHVAYAPIDFNKTTLEQALLEDSSVGYDPSARTLFFWEGVCYYLDQESVHKVLNFIRDSSPAQSTLVFDYFQQAALEGRTSPYGAQTVMKRNRKKGEPFVFGIEETLIENFLSDHNLELLTHMNPRDATSHYLSDKAGGLLGKQHAYLNMVKARTIPQT
ncbi:MAG: SAM-dependent methyltransferase [Desulfatibacillum sp.]|nr:SAM-dependent methyltransferase [Desulfatibacillum sp.]